MPTPKQLKQRRFDLQNMIANQRMAGSTMDEHFLYELTEIIETVEEDFLAALDALKQRVIRGEVF